MNKIYILILLIFSFSFSAFCQNDDKEEVEKEKDYLLIAKNELDSNNYRNVIKTVDEAIEKGKETNKLYEKRAIAYYKTKDIKKSFKDIDKIVFEEDKDFLIYPILCLYYISKEEELDAVNSLILPYKKNNKMFYSSISILNKIDIKKILELIDKELLEKEPIKELYAIKSIINYSNGSLNDSYSDLTTAIENEKENGFLYYILGGIKQKGKEYISAVSSYNSAILYNYKDIDVYKQRAVSKGFLDDFSGAIDDYNTIIKKKPNDYEAYYLRAIAKNYLRDYNGAIYDLNKSISINDTFASAYNYRAVVYANVEDYASALLDFYKTLSIEPNHPFTHNNIGLALVHSGQSIKAEKYFSRAIELDPKHADAYYNRAKLRFNSGDISKSKSDFLKSIELNFKNPDAHYHLALIYIKEKNKFPNKKLEEKICNELKIASEMNHEKAQALLLELCHKDDNQVIEENQENKGEIKE